MQCRLALLAAMGGLLAGAISPAAENEAAKAEAPAQAPKFSAADLEFFEKQVRPLLVARCYECHGPESKKPGGGLQLDSRARILAGGDTGPAIVPGETKKSLLVDAVNYGELYQMPPKSKLPAGEIAILTKWVEKGAPWPAETTTGPRGEGEKFDIAARKKAHWSWRPIRRPEPPAVQDGNWPASPIDHFILARLEAEGLRPAPQADRRTLIRRLYFDLLGLPPSPQEVEEFVADKAPRAYERLVERLLKSPHFGERWARHWLDLMRYAESRGHEFDLNIPNAWQYRDYVIRALNADVPYDQFVLEHIAGDLLEKPRMHPTEKFNESVLGTGFWFLGEGVHSPVDIRQDETDRIDNMLDVFSKSFLGLTVSCARCHDHKFDAISQADYYALAGYLQSSAYRQVRFDTIEHNRKIAGQLAELREDTSRKIAAAIIASRQESVGRTAEYLLAARKVLAADATGAARDAQLAAQANHDKLNVQSLRAWITQLEKARNEANHPLHAFAVVALDGRAAQADGFTQLKKTLIARWSEEQAQYAAARKAAEVVVDYSQPGAEDFIQDGCSFGSGPILPGELLFGKDAASLRVATAGRVAKDPIWDGLKLAPGAQNDPGRIGSWVRSGRTFRTRTFTIEHGRIHYLVKGSARAYAVVDSHRINNGPLHGRLILGIRGDKNQHWVSQDLSRYVGHRAHIEFSAQDGQPFELYAVAQGPRPPSLPEQPNAVLVERISAASVDSVEAMARAYASSFKEALESLRGEERSARSAVLADFVLQHETLFSESESPAAESDSNVRRPGASKRGHPEIGTSLAGLLARFHAKRDKLAAQIRRESRLAPALWEGSSENEFLLIRGRSKTPGPIVPRRTLEALGGLEHPQPKRGSGRLELARRLIDPGQNPYIARVMVNRLWQHLTGRGIVASVDNFGVLGQEPTHPELLDWLASEFAAEGWSLKTLIRQIVLSRTYRMSSRPEPRAQEIDPENKLLHRMRIRRLEGEAIRDTVLAISGRLDRRILGPPVPVHLTPFMQGRGRPGSGPVDGGGRRSIYISVRRNFLSPMMLAFDTPIPFTSMGRRNQSNVPAQALIMMNDPLIVQQARVWAERLLKSQAKSPADRVRQAYLAAFSRPPTDEESAAALEFLAQQAAAYGISAEQAATDVRCWADLCHVLMNVKEFIFVS